MPNEYRSGDEPRSGPRQDRTPVEVEVSRSRFHAQQATGLLTPAPEESVLGIDLHKAQVHATLSTAAATRALVLVYQEEATD